MTTTGRWEIVMSDTKLMNWVEDAGAQVWRDRHSRKWTCQVIVAGKVIQPTRDVLRTAIKDAFTEYTDHLAAKATSVISDSI
jgi:hypothetical protein